MKNVFYFWICMAVWLLSACSSQKKGDGEDVQVLMKDSVDASGLQRMQVSDSLIHISSLRPLAVIF